MSSFGPSATDSIQDDDMGLTMLGTCLSPGDVKQSNDQIKTIQNDDLMHVNLNNMPSDLLLLILKNISSSELLQQLLSRRWRRYAIKTIVQDSSRQGREILSKLIAHEEELSSCTRDALNHCLFKSHLDISSLKNTDVALKLELIHIYLKKNQIISYQDYQFLIFASRFNQTVSGAIPILYNLFKIFATEDQQKRLLQAQMTMMTNIRWELRVAGLQGIEKIINLLTQNEIQLLLDNISTLINSPAWHEREIAVLLTSKLVPYISIQQAQELLRPLFNRRYDQSQDVRILADEAGRKILFKIMKQKVSTMIELVAPVSEYIKHAFSDVASFSRVNVARKALTVQLNSTYEAVSTNMTACFSALSVQDDYLYPPTKEYMEVKFMSIYLNLTHEDTLIRHTALSLFESLIPHLSSVQANKVYRPLVELHNVSNYKDASKILGNLCDIAHLLSDNYFDELMNMIRTRLSSRYLCNKERAVDAIKRMTIHAKDDRIEVLYTFLLKCLEDGHHHVRIMASCALEELSYKLNHPELIESLCQKALEYLGDNNRVAINMINILSMIWAESDVLEQLKQTQYDSAIQVPESKDLLSRLQPAKDLTFGYAHAKQQQAPLKQSCHDCQESPSPSDQSDNRMTPM